MLAREKDNGRVRGADERICLVRPGRSSDADHAAAGIAERADRAQRGDAFADGADAHEFSGDAVTGDAMARIQRL